MKLRQIILLLALVGVVGLIYYPILNSDKNDDTSDKEKEELNYLPIVTANNKTRNIAFVSYGQVLPNRQLDITMEVQGVLERQNRTLKQGETFKKGDVLLKIERTEALYNLLARRSAFANLIAGVLPDISIDLPDERQKWETYMRQLDPVKNLPLLPTIKSEKEQLLINNRNIPSEFYSLKAMEEQIEKYYYVAPFDGAVLSSSIEPGAMVTPGMRIATIAKIGDYEIKAPINLNYVNYFNEKDTVTITDARGEYLGTAQLVRKSKAINEQTQSIDGFFRLNNRSSKDIFQGMFVNLQVETPLFEEAVVLPENAVINNTVQILRDSTVVVKEIAVVGSKTDSLFVTGVTDESAIVLEQVKEPNSAIKYIGIKRN